MPCPGPSIEADPKTLRNLWLEPKYRIGRQTTRLRNIFRKKPGGAGVSIPGDILALWRTIHLLLVWMSFYSMRTHVMPQCRNKKGFHEKYVRVSYRQRGRILDYKTAWGSISLRGMGKSLQTKPSTSNEKLSKKIKKTLGKAEEMVIYRHPYNDF